MYLRTHLSSLIGNIHKVLATQETAREHHPIQGKQVPELEGCNQRLDVDWLDLKSALPTFLTLFYTASIIPFQHITT